MLGWLHHLYSQEGMAQLISAGGLLVVALVIFAETGLFIGVALPGDSLLLVTGVCAHLDLLARLQGRPAGGPPLLDLGLPAILATLMAAAFAGNLVNAWFGRWAGGGLRERGDSRWFKRRHLQEATEFFDRWGGWALVAGRFVPVVRTFVPLAAGIAGMGPLRLALCTGLGAALWVGSMVPLGYALASSETLVKELHWLVLAVVAISFVPVAIGLWRRRRGAASASAGADPSNS